MLTGVNDDIALAAAQPETALGRRVQPRMRGMSASS